MAYLLITFVVMDENSVSFSTALFLMRNNLTLSDFLEMLGNFGNGFLFMGLGIFIAWGYLGKTNTANIRSAEAMLSTLRPNPLYASYQNAH